MLRRIGLLLVLVACGRTDLLGAPPSLVVSGPDAGLARDAGTDAGLDGGADAGVDAGFTPKPCIAGTFSLSPAEPVVMLVLDRSGSMDTVFSMGQTRWETLVASLRATLPQIDQTMQIGGLAYPASVTEPCIVPPVAGIWPARGNVSAVITSLESLRPEGPTPTMSALEVAAQVLRGRRAGNSARAMVLATDGVPTCTARPLDDVVATLRRAAADGIPTYVIGIADSAPLRMSLEMMAAAGGRPRSGAQGFYSAQSRSDLERAFSTIRDQVAACSFLTNSVPDLDGGIVVTFDGMSVPPDDGGVGGWKWTDRENGELALVGGLCARAVARPSSLVVTVSCGSRAP